MLIPSNLKTSLTSALVAASTANKAGGVTEQQALANVADAIATCVDAYIRTATIGTPSGPGTIG